MGASPNLLLAGHVAWFWLAAASDASNFLIMTSPTDSTVFWAPLVDDFTSMMKRSNSDKPPNAFKLTSSLKKPTGLALVTEPSTEWGKSDVTRLYISDAHDAKIYAYILNVDYTSMKQSLSISNKREILQVGTNGAEWLSVDSFGNLYYTQPAKDGSGSELLMITKAALAKAPDTTPVPKMLYETKNQPSLTLSPGALAVDNFYLYWANKDGGVVDGSVVKAPMTPKSFSSAVTSGGAVDSQASSFLQMQVQSIEAKSWPSVLAKNVANTYGVCLARDNVFYSAQDNLLYGVKKDGGTIAEVSSAFTAPRGCVYDGYGTIYVADEAANLVYSFPSNMAEIRHVKHIQKIVNVDKPSQIVFWASSARCLGPAVIAAALVALVLGESLDR